MLPISTLMYYVLSTKILQGTDTLVGLFFKKGVLEFVVKTLDKCLTKNFQKFFSKSVLLQRYFSRVLTTTIAKIVWHMKLTEQLSQQAQKKKIQVYLFLYTIISPTFTRDAHTVTILSQLENGLEFASFLIPLTVCNANMPFKIVCRFLSRPMTLSMCIRIDTIFLVLSTSAADNCFFHE